MGRDTLLLYSFQGELCPVESPLGGEAVRARAGADGGGAIRNGPPERQRDRRARTWTVFDARAALPFRESRSCRATAADGEG